MELVADGGLRKLKQERVGIAQQHTMNHVDVDAEGDVAPRSEAPYDLVVADASWPWTENLFAPLAQLGIRLLLIKACDWRNAWQQGRPLRDWLCPRRRVSERHWEQTIVLPPGWMKTYQRGMKPNQ